MKFDIKSKPMKKEVAFTCGWLLSGALHDMDRAVSDIKPKKHRMKWEKVLESFAVLLVKVLRDLEVELDPSKARSRRGPLFKTICLEEALFKIYKYQLPPGQSNNTFIMAMLGHDAQRNSCKRAKEIQQICREFLRYQGWEL